MLHLLICLTYNCYTNTELHVTTRHITSLDQVYNIKRYMYMFMFKSQALMVRIAGWPKFHSVFSRNMLLKYQVQLMAKRAPLLHRT